MNGPLPVNIENLLRQRMNIVGGPPEAMFPKIVGLLFFNDRPQEGAARVIEARAAGAAGSGRCASASASTVSPMRPHAASAAGSG